ncbi:MAG: PQQ-dependent sugar dehydrogenase [Flavobacteriales bacterium]|jgi:glucose/arabinose dehydrogenase
MRNLFLTTFFSALFASAFAQNVTPVQISIEEFYAGLSGPVGIYHCGDDRLFVLEKNQGDIEIIDTTGAYIGKFLDITGMISTGSEQGLLGMAFHPNYTANGFFYINYTNTSGTTVIARYQVSGDPNVADANSATTIMTIAQPFGNHNGGHIAFGPDGYLYIGMGDGGSGGDPGNRAQNLNDLLGKMLRIDVDNGSPFSIPPTNPFVGVPNTQAAIWSYGLRNPWKFSFDRQTGDIWLADVGQNAWEEVNMTPANSTGGENYGWRCYEGNAAYNTAGCAAQSTMLAPVQVYSHSAPTNFCSITGGVVYRGSKYPAMNGIYFFTDYCDGDIYGIAGSAGSGWTSTNYGPGGGAITAIQEDSAGEVYIIRQGGTIAKIKDSCGSFAPVISLNSAGQLESTDANQYWWFNNNEIIPGQTAQTLSPTVAGLYSVNASNGQCTRSSNQIPWVIMGGIPGCTYANATNFDPQASLDNGTCEFGTASDCPGDIDGNGLIGVNDLLLLLEIFGSFCND